MKDVNGKRTCLKCIENTRERDERRKAAQEIWAEGAVIDPTKKISKTEAMKIYGLSAKDMERLQVVGLKPNPIDSRFSAVKLYNESKCAALGDEKKKVKEGKAKEKREKEVEKERKKAAKVNGSPKKKTEKRVAGGRVTKQKAKGREVKRMGNEKEEMGLDEAEVEDHGFVPLLLTSATATTRRQSSRARRVRYVVDEDEEKTGLKTPSEISTRMIFHPQTCGAYM